MPGRSSVGHPTMLLPTMAGRPRTKASHAIRRPPAGWTSSRRSRSPAADAEPEVVEGAGLTGRRGRSPGWRPTRRVGRRASRRTCPATAGRPGPGAPARSRAASGSRRPSSRRSGRVRVRPRSAGGSPAARRPATDRATRRAGRRASRPARPPAPVSSRRRRAPSACATIGPVSSPSSMRISVTPVSGVTGEDRRRDRRRAAVPRQQRRVEVEGAVARVEQGRRHDPAVVGEDEQIRHQGQHVDRSRRRRAAASG